MATQKHEPESATKVEAPKTKKIQMLKYTGKGSEKILTEKDFHNNGISDQKTVRWHNLNGYMVPVDSFSEAGLQLAVAQPTLELVEVEVDADGTQV